MWLTAPRCCVSPRSSAEQHGEPLLRSAPPEGRVLPEPGIDPQELGRQRLRSSEFWKAMAYAHLRQSVWMNLSALPLDLGVTFFFVRSRASNMMTCMPCH